MRVLFFVCIFAILSMAGDWLALVSSTVLIPASSSDRFKPAISVWLMQDTLTGSTFFVVSDGITMIALNGNGKEKTTAKIDESILNTTKDNT